MEELDSTKEGISLPQEPEVTQEEMNNALKEMMAENAAITEVSLTEHSIPDVSMVSATDVATSPSPMPKKSPLHIIEEISKDMADFFDSLKEFEGKAAKVADMWFANAAAIESSNGKLNEKQQEELFVNVTLGIVTLGLTNLFTTGLAMFQRNQLKGILKSQAENKLEGLQDAVQMQEETYNVAFSRFKEASTYAERQKLFVEYRRTAYYLDCTKYLIATYEAALENRFQNSVPYPSFYHIDCEIFYSQVTKTRRASSAEAILEAKTETIIKTAMEGAEALVENRDPSVAAGLLGSDEAVTGMAVLDVMPTFTINEEGEVQSSLVPHEEDEDEDTPDMVRKNSPLLKLMVLKECAEGKNTPFALAVRRNKVLDSVTKHCMAIGATHNQYENINILHGINTLLFGVLFFCIFFVSWDLAWYWSLGLGVVGFFIAQWMAPWTTLKERYNDKIAMICCCIQQEAKKASGHAVDVLAEINASTKKRLWILILGGIIGLIAGPIGCLIGLLIGASVGGFFDGKEQEVNVDDYEAFSIGSKTKPIIIMCVLGLLIIGIIFAGPIEW